MEEFEKELKVGFLEEAKQLIADAEQCFLDLEQSANDSKGIEKIFRLAHNIKGSASAVGFTELSAFTHTFETLLLKIKNNEIKIHKDIISLLLRCNDCLCQMVEGLQQNLEATFDNTQLLAEITDAIAGKLTPPTDYLGVEEPETQEPTGAHHPPAKIQAQSKVQTPPPPQQTNTASGKTDESIRVGIHRIDKLVNNVGELVILQTVLAQHKQVIQSSLVQKTIHQLEKITREIQDISMSLRMVPLKQTFQKMQRIVRDTSTALNKDVRLEISGEETELDKTVLEQLGDPLVHLIRNAVDHGLERTEDRHAAGKPTQGVVRLSAYHRGSHIVIEVKDDGKGLDPKKLIAKAAEKGIVKSGQEISDDQAYQLIFASGFSTAAVVTNVSGRGVGMDVVRTNISQMKGDIQIETALGKGTCFRVLLPLTIAIVDGMVVRVADQNYVVPITNVYESLRPKSDEVATVTGTGEVLKLRGETLPLYRLSKLLGIKQNKTPAWEATAMVVRNAKLKPFAILVDDIVRKQQVVIKRLGDDIAGTPGVAGGAILGDGKAALILDFNEMVEKQRSTAIKRGA